MTKIRNFIKQIGWGLNRESARWISSGGGAIQTAMRMANESSAQFILENISVGQLFETRAELHNFAKNKFNELPRGLYLEFGVWKGSTLKNFSSALPIGSNIFGFDSFEGLINPWSYPGHGLKSFNLGGEIPKSVLAIERATIIKGRVEKTLRKFLLEKNEKVSFVHIDLDVYEPVDTVLKELKPYLQPGTLIVFDELLGYPGWQNHEKRAIDENFQGVNFEWLAFTNLQALMRIN